MTYISEFRDLCSVLHALKRTCNTGSMRVHSNYLYSIFSVRYTYTVILITNS